MQVELRLSSRLPLNGVIVAVLLSASGSFAGASENCAAVGLKKQKFGCSEQDARNSTGYRDARARPVRVSAAPPSEGRVAAG
jgi:hypothetical protein